MQATIEHDVGLCAALLYDISWSSPWKTKPSARDGADKLERMKEYLTSWTVERKGWMDGQSSDFILHQLSRDAPSHTSSELARQDKKAIELLITACNETGFTLWFVCAQIIPANTVNPYSGRNRVH